MNTTELPVRPEVPEVVRTFVARVRDRLADLPAEELQDLTEGLEADLSDLVAERGGEALGDPDEYAQELRSAAGLEAAPRRRLRIERGLSLGARLDRYSAWWHAEMQRKYLDQAWPVIAALRPAWWVARAWIAAVLVCVLLPGYFVWGYSWLPGVSSELGLAVLALCVVGSTLVGLGRVWPGPAEGAGRGTTARVVLIALNVFAILMIPTVTGQVQEAKWRQVEDTSGFSDTGETVGSLGVMNRGEQVCNISAYDAQGQPLLGVQLFDQAGQPISTRCSSQGERKVPWMLGDVPRWNVYPQAVRNHAAWTQRQKADATGAEFPTPDRATTPAVSNPVATALSEQRAAAKAERKQERQDQRRAERRDARR